MTTRQPFPYNVRVSGKYGAPMGRADQSGDPDYKGRLHVRKVPLDGDYDGGGAYWGCNSRGSYLYCIFSPDRSIVHFDRFEGERAAVEWAREEYPDADLGDKPARKIDRATGYDTRDASPEASRAFVAAAINTLKGF